MHVGVCAASPTFWYRVLPARGSTALEFLGCIAAARSRLHLAFWAADGQLSCQLSGDGELTSAPDRDLV